VRAQVLCVTNIEPDGSTSVSAKISDFGLALRAMPLPTGRGWGSVSTPPRGTPAYMAPELFAQRDGQGCVEVRGSLALPREGSLHYCRCAECAPVSTVHRCPRCATCTASACCWPSCSQASTAPKHPLTFRSVNCYPRLWSSFMFSCADQQPSPLRGSGLAVCFVTCYISLFSVSQPPWVGSMIRVCTALHPDARLPFSRLHDWLFTGGLSLAYVNIARVLSSRRASSSVLGCVSYTLVPA
jgi:serine/threonine protein kinase